MLTVEIEAVLALTTELDSSGMYGTAAPEGFVITETMRVVC